jgi:hypothetical protein
MADTSKIVASLQQAMEGLGSAQQAAAQAGAGAQKVQSHAAQSGFRGVAEGVGQVVERLKRIQEMQAKEADTVKRTAEIVTQVTDDMSPAEIVSTLTPAAQQAGSVHTGTAGVLTEVDRAKTQVASVLRGGQPGPLIGLLDQIKQALLQVIGSIGEAKQVTDETIAEAQKTGNL